MTYKPKVASNESTIFRKIGFVKTSPSVNPRPPSEAAVAAAIFSMPLKARRNAATYFTISLHESGAKTYPYRHIHRNYREANEGGRVAPFRALRPVPQREDKAHYEQAHVEVRQDDVDDVDAFEVETRVLHGVGQDAESDEVICLQWCIFRNIAS